MLQGTCIQHTAGKLNFAKTPVRKKKANNEWQSLSLEYLGTPGTVLSVLSVLSHSIFIGSYEVSVIRPILQTRKPSHAGDNKAELGISPRGYLTLARQVGGGRRKRKNPRTT